MAIVETIPKLMRKHHYQLEGLFNRFYKSRNTTDDSNEIFSKFKWELKKHFLTEEKAIFTFIYAEDRESNEMKTELLKEHRLILHKLDEIENNSENFNNIDLKEFQNLLKNHRDFEDAVFYPKLEEELDDLKKKEIMDKISNPV